MTHLLTTVLCLAFPIICGAQSLKERVDGYPITGFVREAFEGKPLIGAKVELLTADSTLIKETVTTEVDHFPDRNGRYSTSHTERGEYIVRVSAEGYETKCVRFKITSKRQFDVRVPTIYLMKAVRVLDEVTVTATKVKMVVRGDTLVYNADAFHLPEGSMLDALIRKLPGAELKGDRIFVNGRFVESLLVNGKDFFTGSAALALQNLPAYTVRNIKVYDRQGERSVVTGRDMGDKKYVMDVNLKREYRQAWIANADAAGGTHGKFLAKAAGLRFSDKSRTLLYANCNNIGNGQTASSRGADWSRTGAPTTDMTSTRAGFAYQYQPKKMFSKTFVTDNSIAYDDSDLRTWTVRETFLQGGNTFNKGFSQKTAKSFSLATKNSFETWIRQKRSIRMCLDAAYTKRKADGSDLNAAFEADPEEIRDLQKDAFEPDITSVRAILNRSKALSANDGSTFRIGGEASGNVSVLSDFLMWRLEARHEDNRDDSFAFSNYEYARAETAGGRRNTYRHAPRKNTSISLNTMYDIKITRTSHLAIDLTAEHVRNSSDDLFYRLDRLEGADTTGIYSKATLPSAAEALTNALDGKNSTLYKEDDTDVTLDISYRRSPQFGQKRSVGYSVGVPLSLLHRTMDYFRVSRLDIRRTDWRANPYADITYNWSNGNVSLKANYYGSQPMLTQLADFTDDSDPLSISKGNPDLRNPRTLNTEIAVGQSVSRIQLRASASYSRMYNAIANGMVYDRLLGVTTSQPMNVNGNWKASGTLLLYGRADKRGKLNLSSNLTIGNNHSVDLTGVQGVDETTLSRVDNLNLSELLRLTWEICPKVSLTINGSARYNHMTGDRKDFVTVSAVDFTYGGELVAELPWSFQLVTDANMSSRRGYAYKEMNTNELVWNARLSRPVIKGLLTATVEGYDILGNLSTKRYALNSQGRTESFTNVLPSFVMLRLSLNLTKTPKKKA